MLEIASVALDLELEGKAVLRVRLAKTTRAVLHRLEILLALREPGLGALDVKGESRDDLTGGVCTLLSALTAVCGNPDQSGTDRVLVCELTFPVGLAVLELALPAAGLSSLLVFDLAQLRREFLPLLGQPALERAVRLLLILKVGGEDRELLDLRLLELEVLLRGLVQLDELVQVALRLCVLLRPTDGSVQRSVSSATRLTQTFDRLTDLLERGNDLVVERVRVLDLGILRVQLAFKIALLGDAALELVLELLDARGQLRRGDGSRARPSVSCPPDDKTRLTLATHGLDLLIVGEQLRFPLGLLILLNRHVLFEPVCELGVEVLELAQLGLQLGHLVPELQDLVAKGLVLLLALLEDLVGTTCRSA
jgi:hypothetical protein